MGSLDATIIASRETGFDQLTKPYAAPDLCIQISDWDPGPIRVYASKVSIVAPLDRTVIILETISGDSIQLDIDMGHIAWIPDGLVHTIATKKGSAILVQAEARELNQFFRGVSGQELGLHLTPVSHLVAQAGQRFCNSGDGNAAQIGKAFATLVATELSLYSGTRSVPKSNGARALSSNLSRIDRFIMENIEEKITVSDMAGLTGLSVHQFIRCFKDLKGISPYKYVVRKRVLIARRLLVEDEFSIAEIAYAVGFSSQSHLTQTFRQHMGTSPGNYRRAAR